MPIEMSVGELEAQRAKASKIDSFEYRDEDDDDDFIIADLYRCANGRYFRYIESTGMNSAYSGAGEFGEWLDEKEVENWTEF